MLSEVLQNQTCLCVCLAGLSNIIGIIVYISAAAGDPNQSESKRSHWYGWSFYCGAFSFVATEMVGVVTIHLFIDAHRRLRAANPSAHRRALTHTNSHSSYTHNNHGCSLSRSRHPSGTRNSSYRSRYRRQPSYRSSQAAAPPTPTSTMTTLWRPPITADLPAWPLYPMGYPHTHTHSSLDAQNAHAELDAHTHTHLNSLRRNNSCPQTLSDEALALALATHTHPNVLTHVQSDGSLANTLTHTHYDPHAHTHAHSVAQARNSVESGGVHTHTCDAEEVTHTLTHTGNNIAHTQNSVQSHTHNSTLDNTYTHTHEHEHAHLNSAQEDPHTDTHTYAYTNNCAQENAHVYTHTHAHNSIQENSHSATRRTTPV